ncbi:MAG: FdtA/QdtA family cupin domain-containing protein [Candidatus Gracilibacteria bacterium]
MRLEKITLKTFTDESGSLTPVELKDFVDWPVKRIYYLTDVKGSRGGHCVKGEKKIYICQKGAVKCRFHDGGVSGKKLASARDANASTDWVSFELRGPSEGVLMEGDYYRDFYEFEPGTVLLAVSSVNYDPKDYIYDLNEFIEWRKKS